MSIGLIKSYISVKYLVHNSLTCAYFVGKASFGEHEWYFFSPRDRKYPNGARPNRVITSGYWKATGTDKPIITSNGNQKVGVKKALVFYGGKPSKGIKTNWIMHEYRLIDSNSNSKAQIVDLPNRRASLRLDDWVLCRIYKKNSSQRLMERDKNHSALPSFNHQNHGALLEHEENYYEGILTGDSMQNSSISQIAVSSSAKQSLPRAFLLATTTNSILAKQAITGLQYWNNEPNSTGSQSGKPRFQDDLNSISIVVPYIDDTNSSFVSLLSHQLPQNAPFKTSTIVGSLVNGVSR